VCHNVFEYFKLLKIVIVFVLGSVEDERCFPSLKFLKSTFITNWVTASLHGCEEVSITIFHINSISLYKKAIES
jgi:hypothetical protein